MTDNEIIKYLEQAIDEYNKNEIFVDNIRLDKLSLDIIYRQQAEIERLKIENQSLRSAANSCKLHYNEARAEAVKEFVENVTYCKYCKNYELMTSNNQHFCNRYGGYVKETDCCSRGYTL